MLLRKAFAGGAVCLAPSAFVQANFGAMNVCLAEILQVIPPGSSIADLHAGVGTIGAIQAPSSCQNPSFLLRSG